MVRSRLEQHDQELLRAELRGADFGVYVAITLPAVAVGRAETALATTLRAWPSLRARIVREDGVFVAVDTPVPGPDGEVAAAQVIEAPEWLRAYAASDSLADQSILATRGGPLLRYHLDAAGRTLHLLGHHVVLDADSLEALLADLDLALAGEAIPGSPEWPWPVADEASAPADGAGLEGGAGVEHAAYETLVPKGRPAAGTHVRLALTTAQADAVAKAARAAGASPFAIYWAAGERLGENAIGAVVSTRLTAARPSRAGNATTYLSVGATATGAGRDYVRGAFEDVVATWAGARPPAAATPGQLLVSLSQPPAAGRHRVIEAVRLGDYVVKYPRHVQVQADGTDVVLEAYAATGAPALLSAYADALARVVGECLAAEAGGAEDWSVGPVGRNTPPVADPAPDVAEDADPLSRILAAPAHEHLRDLGISSLDVLAILEGLGERFGVRVGVEAFYGWETAGEVHAVAGTAAQARDGGTGASAGEGSAYDPQAVVTLPHLNDIFIDAFRHAADDPYAVEFAFVVDPALGLTRSALAARVGRVLTRHEAFAAALGFSRDGVVLRPRAAATLVREVSGSAYEEIRDPRRLTLRAPAHLADVAVAQIGADLAVYLNVHHLLLDHFGLAHLLADLDAELTGAAPQPSTPWALLAPRLDQARTAALDVWRSAPPARAVTGRRGLPGGGHRQARLGWGTGAEIDLAAELATVTEIVAAFTEERAGVIGSVHHGRTVPGSDRLVGNLARMLPAHYDVDDPSVVRASARRLLAGQAATLGDLALDPGQPMPVVFHVVREDAALPSSLVRRVDFPARTKFALLFTLVVTGEARTLEITVADDLYSPSETQTLIDLALRVRDSESRFAPEEFRCVEDVPASGGRVEVAA